MMTETELRAEMPREIWANDAGKNRKNFNSECKGGIWSVFPVNVKGTLGKQVPSIQKYKRIKYLRSDLAIDRATLVEKIEGLKRSEDGHIGIGSLATARGYNAALDQVLALLKGGENGGS